MKQICKPKKARKQGVPLTDMQAAVLGAVKAAPHGCTVSTLSNSLELDSRAVSGVVTRLAARLLIFATHPCSGTHNRWTTAARLDAVRAEIEAGRAEAKERARELDRIRRREKYSAKATAIEKDDGWADKMPTKRVTSAKDAEPLGVIARRWVFDAEPVRVGNGR